MGNKRLNKELRELAGKLPLTFTPTKEKGYYTGKELMEEMGYEKDKDGRPLNPEQTYYIELPVELARNHYRRLKKAYKSKGMTGVNHYLTTLDKIITPQLKNELAGVQ